MKPAKWYRKGATLISARGVREKFRSKSEAKRESRQRQLTEDGALGRGSVQVI